MSERCDCQTGDCTHRAFQPVVRRGIAYWPTAEVALGVRDRVAAEHPNARVVVFEAGWAVQVERGGAYLDAEGRPCR